MQDRLLKINEVVELLSTSNSRDRSILIKNKVYPIDLGLGRSGGYRWLESLVIELIQDLSREAQPKDKHKKRVRSKKSIDILSLSNEELIKLTTGK